MEDNPKSHDQKQQKPKSGEIDPKKELSGEKKSRGEKRRDQAELKKEAERLQTFQKSTYPQVEAIVTECLSCIMPMGWSFGAVVNEEGVPEFKIMPLSLAQYQEIKKQKLRAELSGLA